MKISKILIANRGEIALRVVKTCKRLGIETVTIFASDDARLPHACAGDENIALGRGSLSDTYLNAEKIIQIAQETKAQAIHPGYGFLSENTDFCKMVQEAGLIFIGPSTHAIELMGDKKTSKVKMEEIGIPLIPGYHGDDQDPALLFEEAKKIGFPVLIKATAGGGGKGMRIVETEKGFSDALDASKREALNAFKNDKVLLEKYIINPRHIEVQLVSDGKKNHFHFFERECSIQRRYQKVIEETPSVALTPELRREICESAVKIAAGIDYVGAGTIEYILGPDNKFYFLEMNTRLQVEHPITEMVTGFDLVELQIMAAEGKAFPFEQKDIKQIGHALECRIYAEDPDVDFLPTNGRIQKIELPSSIDYRLDCGYMDGNQISLNYDPMLAKLITFGEEREEAIESMQESLNVVCFGGTKTNRDYLKRVLDHEKFMSGDIHTHFLAQEKDFLEIGEPSEFEVVAICASILFKESIPFKNVWDQEKIGYTKKILLDGEEFKVLVKSFGNDNLELEYFGEKYKFHFTYKKGNSIGFTGHGGDFQAEFFLLNTNGEYQLFLNHGEFKVKSFGKVERANSAVVVGAGSLQSPMPGKIFKILKDKGQKVIAGETVLILEAMKMEHAIKAPKDGVVTDIFFKEGEQVQGGVSLCDIDSE